VNNRSGKAAGYVSTSVGKGAQVVAVLHGFLAASGSEQAAVAPH